MEDQLKQTLLDRAASPTPSPENAGKPVVHPPGGMPTTLPMKPQGVPPAWQRWIVSQNMQAAYRNPTWNPNPVLIGISD